LCRPLWGAHEALAFGGNVGIGCQRPARRIRSATAGQRAGCLCSAPSPVYNWGGIYFINLGYAFGTSVWSDPIDPGGGTTGNFNLRGFLTGVTAGANFQTDAGDLAIDPGAVEIRSYYPPLPPAIYDWIGIYVGGHIGGGMLWLTP
jgi:hypothetical protein